MPNIIASGSEFLGPIFALMALTALVWVYMYYVRINFMMKNKISAESLKGAAGKSQLDGPQNTPAENYNHLFEIPVLFYVVSILFVLTGKGDDFSLTLAWVYVGLRLIHSVIQCSYNKIMHRFSVFVLSSLVLFVLIAQAATKML